MRLFTAVNLSSAEKERVYDAVRRIRREAEKGSFSRRENLHITLEFLGETDRIAAACRALDAVNTPAFALRLAGLGRFEKRGGDVLWMGVEYSAALMELQGEVRASLVREGFAVGSGPYRPHVTLGRRAVLSRERECVVASVLPGIPVAVDSISLMRSHRVEEALTYSEIHRTFLGK